MQPKKSSERAFTMVEVCVLGVLLGLLVLMFLGEVHHPHRNASRIKCVNNLKNIGLAYRIFAVDNKDKFPQQISTNNGGTLEFTGPIDIFRHFQVLSNELSTPKIVVCPNDTRKEAANFNSLSNANISFFVSLDAKATNFHGILSGDRNLAGLPQSASGPFILTTNSRPAWGKGLHFPNGGNIALEDGSVQQLSNNRLIQAVTNLPGPARILIP